MTIREIAKETVDIINNSNKAVLVWKNGRSWQYAVLESCNLTDKTMSRDDYDLYRKAKAADAQAFVANNDGIPRHELYWTSRLTIDDLANGYRTLHDRTDSDALQGCEIVESVPDVVEHIRRHPDGAYMVRPVSFHGFGIYYMTGDFSAECLARDLTPAEANALVRQGRDMADRDRRDAYKVA